MIYFQLIWVFFKIGLFSFGGGYAILNMISSEIVTNYGWITENEFADVVTLSQLTPGPVAINSATFVGTRVAGIAGSICATFGLILPSIIIMMIVSVLYKKYKDMGFSKGLLFGMRPATTGLIAAVSVSLILGAIFIEHSISNINWISLFIFIAAFIVIRFLKKSPILVILCSGAVGLGLYYLFGK